MKYTYIIIEDNQGAIKNLRTALKSYVQMEEVGCAENVNDGLNLILTKKPHFVFLDIVLGFDNGYDVMDEIKRHSSPFPFFIIITQYNKYAKEAVNKDALYFLDKPIDPDELAAAIHKVEQRFFDLQKTINIKNSEGHFFIDLKTIQYINGSNNYCVIHRENAKPMLLSRTLKDMEAELPPTFIRIHKGYIINRAFVQMMNTTNRFVRMTFTENESSGELQLPIGNMYLERVKKILLAP